MPETNSHVTGSPKQEFHTQKAVYDRNVWQTCKNLEKILERREQAALAVQKDVGSCHRGL